MLSGDLKERMKSELVHGQIIDIHLKIRKLCIADLRDLDTI